MIHGLSIVCAKWNRRMKFLEELPSNPVRGVSGTLHEALPAIELEIVPLAEASLFYSPLKGSPDPRSRRGLKPFNANELQEYDATRF